MSHCTVYTACLEGSEVLEVAVEVDIQRGLPWFTIIGLPDKRIDEAKERVKAAIKNSGYEFPLSKITVNLAPSSVRKRGTGFDLAIALGILIVTGAVQQIKNAWVVGELGLNGEVRAYSHLASVLIAAKERGVPCLIPRMQVHIAGLVGNREISGVQNLREAVQKPVWITVAESHRPIIPLLEKYLIDAIQGQEQGKRALLIALAGKHHLLLTGPPGVGKTLLAEAARELLPVLDREELLEIMQLHAYANLEWNGERPFRVPAYSVTQTGLFGGGNPLRPGEVSLAHRGVLFLDELPLFSREVLEGFRYVLSNQQAVHNRAGKRHIFPASFILIAARNPCACGRMGVEGQECICGAAERAKYGARLSEPLLDRCELFCDVPVLQSKEWNGKSATVGTEYRQQIEKVWRDEKIVTWSKEGRTVLSQAVDSFKLSGRGRTAVCTVAETIARLNDVHTVEAEHMREALQFRRKALF